MNLTETSQVLIKIQAFNNRTFDQANIAAWHETIGDLDLADCLTAVGNYFRESKDWIMPADIRQGVGKIRAKRLEAIHQNVRLRDEDEDLDNMKLSFQRHRHLTNLLASGQITAEQYHEYHAGKFQIPGMPKELAR